MSSAIARRPFLAVLACALLTAAAPAVASGSTAAAELSFEQRVAAQEAIERVYHAHQIGATMAFDQAVPRALLERKVTTYLQQTAALERYWDTPVTGEMLQAELDRIVRSTRMPDRLREMFAALGGDATTIRECLARPALVDRLARRFLAMDRIVNPAALPWDAWWAEAHVGLPADSAVIPFAGASDLESAPSAAIVSAATACSNEVQWENGALEELLDGRSYHTAVWTGSHMIVWGGADATGYLNTGARYDPLTDTWTRLAMMRAPVPRSRHEAVWTGTEMLVWGGEGLPGVESGGRYDPATDAWREMTIVDAPRTRTGHTLVWTGTEMILWGGYSAIGTETSPAGPSRDGWRYDPATDVWTRTSVVDAPERRQDHTAVWTGTEMIVWGGSTVTPVAGQWLNSGGRYDPVTDAWAPTSAGAPQGRARHAAVWTGREMVIFGGVDFNLNPIPTAARYDPATNVWRMARFQAYTSGGADQAYAWTGTHLVVWGGETRPSNYVSGGVRYDPLADVWAPIATANAPQARSGMTGVWSGAHVIVWGGFTGYNQTFHLLDTGGRYDPVADSWTPVSRRDAPTARALHTAVWTGTHMIVWGGMEALSPTDTGARYDPALDAWSPTATIGAPSARADHAAVWTGAEMFLWGGTPQLYTCTPSCYLASGGRYDPIADVWRPVSTADAPESRKNPALVWTGSHAVVWGGAGSGTGWLDTGNRYDPALDAWTPTGTSGAPAGLSFPEAIWTGHEMIVWSYPGAGGRYEPSTDAWAPVSALNAPEGRFHHTLVWTGSRMIVWGGERAFYDQVGTGGIYDPSSDAWSPISGVNAPDPRTEHTAVWTGAEMIVWGGNVPPPSLVSPYFRAGTSTGSRYDPLTDTWRATSMVRAPSPRSSHTAVWTGDMMIVWGGSAGYPVDSANLGTGGRLVVDTPRDGDGDGVNRCGGDCDDTEASAWSAPGEVPGLALLDDAKTLVWSEPDFTGATRVVYDAIRAADASDLHASSICLASGGADTLATDASSPEPGSVWFYLVRARNDCPGATGPLGSASDGTPRTARACP